MEIDYGHRFSVLPDPERDRLERCKLFLGDTMSAGILVAILIAIFVAIFLPILSGKYWRAEQETARARRLAEAKMNARLLRLDI